MAHQTGPSGLEPLTGHSELDIKDLSAGLLANILECVVKGDQPDENAEAWQHVRSVSRSWLTAANLHVTSISMQDGLPQHGVPHLLDRFPNLQTLYLSQKLPAEDVADGEAQQPHAHLPLLNKESTTMRFCTLPAKFYPNYKSTPGVVYADILPAVMRTALLQPGVKSMSCFHEDSYICIGNGHLIGDGTQQDPDDKADGEAAEETRSHDSQEAAAEQAVVPLTDAAFPDDDPDINADYIGAVNRMLPAWKIGTAAASQLHVQITSEHLWRQLVTRRPEFLAQLLDAKACLHLVTHRLLRPEEAAIFDGLHGITVNLPPRVDSRRHLLMQIGGICAALAFAPSVRQVVVNFTKQMNWVGGMHEVLRKTGDLDIFTAYFGAVKLYYHCHHVWCTEHDFDEAVICFNREYPWNEDQQRAILSAYADDEFAEATDEMDSLWEEGNQGVVQVDTVTQDAESDQEAGSPVCAENAEDAVVAEDASYEDAEGAAAAEIEDA